MKIKKSEVRLCEKDGEKIKVLEIIYTHKGVEGKFQVSGYEEKLHSIILSSLRKFLRETSASLPN